MAGSASLLAVSRVTWANSSFLACEDKNIAEYLRVVSGGSSLFLGGVVPTWCWVMKLHMAVAAYAALLAALASYTAARPLGLLFTNLEKSHVVAYFAGS